MATKTSKRLMADQAFPFLKPHEDVGTYIPGMTLRDYFAAMAMQSMNGRPDYADAPASAIAMDAYSLADAMLEIRK